MRKMSKTKIGVLLVLVGIGLMALGALVLFAPEVLGPDILNTVGPFLVVLWMVGLFLIGIGAFILQIRLFRWAFK
jgi:uncharacterized membrane protein YidH (DUF202 family)